MMKNRFLKIASLILVIALLSAGLILSSALVFAANETELIPRPTHTTPSSSAPPSTTPPSTPVQADFDGSGAVDSDDAIYLLFHTLLPEEYPVSQNADLDKSGAVDSDDAIYLLFHTLLPEEYPL